MIVATAGFELVHVTDRPVSVAPLASRGVAVARPLCPGASDAALSDTVTVATGEGAGAAITFAIIVDDTPETVRVIVDDPSDTPVRSPDDDTVAPAALLDDHFADSPVIAVPDES